MWILPSAIDVELANFQFGMCWYACNAKGFEGGKLSCLRPHGIS